MKTSVKADFMSPSNLCISALLIYKFGLRESFDIASDILRIGSEIDESTAFCVIEVLLHCLHDCNDDIESIVIQKLKNKKM
jgi:hypothetical protein